MEKKNFELSEDIPGMVVGGNNVMEANNFIANMLLDQANNAFDEVKDSVKNALKGLSV